MCFGRRRGGGGGGGLIVVYLAALLVWVISYFLIRALSRYREYAADRGSAIITGAPRELSSALLKISGTIQRIPERDLRQVEGMNAFFIVPAVTGSRCAELFSTHPRWSTGSSDSEECSRKWSAPREDPRHPSRGRTRPSNPSWSGSSPSPPPISP